MTMQYIAFNLTHGQMTPIDSSGLTISGTGEIIWVGEEGTFDFNARFGTILSTDLTPIDTIEYRVMTQEEIDIYLESL